MEERSITTPFCYIRHRDGLRDDKHLSVLNKQPVSKEQQCFERNHKPKMESFQKIQLKKQEKEGLITVSKVAKSGKSFTIKSIKCQFPSAHL